MIRRVISLTLALALLIPPWGCAGISITKAEGPVPRGVRVYPPQILLLVNAEAEGGKGRTSIIVVPNLAGAYDVRPVTFLAKNDFRIDLNDGMMSSLRSAQDTTAIITLIKGAGDIAAGAAGVGVSAREYEGSYGLPSGLYRLMPDWTLKRLPMPVQPEGES